MRSLLFVSSGILLSSLLLPAVARAGAAESIAAADKLRLLEWQNGKALEAIPLYESAAKEGADEYEIAWKTASAYFWAGENVTDAKKLEKLGEKCLASAEKAAKLKPDRVEGNYYTAVCWGTYSHGISIPSAIVKGVEGKFKGAAGKAEKIDPAFENGAPLNAFGRFYFELPWPKRDLAKSQKYLERNITQSPCNLRTRWYYAETVLKRGEKVDGRSAKTVARENLQYVLDNEHCAENPGDGELAKAAARKLIKNL